VDGEVRSKKELTELALLEMYGNGSVYQDLRTDFGTPNGHCQN
jgi:hypothetical protein